MNFANKFSVGQIKIYSIADTILEKSHSIFFVAKATQQCGNNSNKNQAKMVAKKKESNFTKNIIDRIENRSSAAHENRLKFIVSC